MRLLIAAAALAVPLVPVAAAPHSTTPHSAMPQVAPLRLNPARIDRALHKMVSDGRAVGVLALIWKDRHESYFGSAGFSDREAARLIRRDNLFQIFSMTKPVTGVGLMRLWEQGRFGLDDPLARYLPEFASARLFIGMDSSGKPILKAPDRPITVRDIIRHTAGFAYADGATYPEHEMGRIDPLNVHNTLAQFSAKMASVPLMFEPGAQWRYSAAVDVQARLVEVLSGMPFEAYMKQQVLGPLGMKDSGWTQPADRFPRLATPYVVGPDAKLVRKSDADIRKLNFSDRKLTQGGSGLASTADDYLRFARMLLGQGALDGVRVLKPSTIKLMSTDQLDPKITERLWLPSKGNGGFGLDFFVRKGQPINPQENRGALGEFFWDGAWSTLFWVDPANRMAVVFLVQKDPFDGSLHHDLREAVYGADYLGPKGD